MTAFDLQSVPAAALPAAWQAIIREGVATQVWTDAEAAWAATTKSPVTMRDISTQFIGSQAVPEPGSALLVAAVGLILLVRHRRRLP